MTLINLKKMIVATLAVATLAGTAAHAEYPFKDTSGKTGWQHAEVKGNSYGIKFTRYRDTPADPIGHTLTITANIDGVKYDLKGSKANRTQLSCNFYRVKCDRRYYLAAKAFGEVSEAVQKSGLKDTKWSDWDWKWSDNHDEYKIYHKGEEIVMINGEKAAAVYTLAFNRDGHRTLNDVAWQTTRKIN